MLINKKCEKKLQQMNETGKEDFVQGYCSKAEAGFKSMEIKNERSFQHWAEPVENYWQPSWEG
jgi:hypothetical protein